MKRAAALLLVASACAHGKPSRIDVEEPLVVTGTPRSEAAAALERERRGEWAEALDLWLSVLHARPEDVDAQMHAAVAEHHTGRIAAAADRLHALAARPGLDARRRAEAVVQEGICRIELGAREEGTALLRQALQGDDVAPGVASQAEFWLGEAEAASFRERRLDPERMDDAALSEALEAKSRLLLSAQDHYLRCIRRGDPQWAVAAGSRIGSLYDGLHREMTGAPLPPHLDARQRELYRTELRRRVRVLLEKALRVYDETLAAARRTGADNAYVEKAGEGLERLRKMLSSEDLAL